MTDLEADVRTAQREMERKARKWAARLFDDERDVEVCAVAKQEQWVSVKERLPEDGAGLVLVMLARPDEIPMRDIGWHDERGWHWRYKKEAMAVTHWCPLPAPPEQEKP